jgi:hypothetical protein
MTIFLFTTASNKALGPIQLPIQWVAGTLSLGIWRLGRVADHSPSSSAEVKESVELYLSPLPKYAYMAWCSVKKKYWDFTFTFTFYGSNQCRK